MTENNKSTVKFILTVVKYAVTLALGFFGGTASASINF